MYFIFWKCTKDDYQLIGKAKTLTKARRIRAADIKYHNSQEIDQYTFNEKDYQIARGVK